MNRHGIVDVIGPEYLTANIEEDEWSYAKDAGNLGKLTEALGGVSHITISWIAGSWIRTTPEHTP